MSFKTLIINILEIILNCEQNKCEYRDKTSIIKKQKCLHK